MVQAKVTTYQANNHTMTDTFEIFDNAGAAGQLLMLLIVIGFVYVITIAPIRVLTGQTEDSRDVAAGSVGLVVWALSALSWGYALTV